MVRCLIRNGPHPHQKEKPNMKRKNLGMMIYLTLQLHKEAYLTIK